MARGWHGNSEGHARAGRLGGRRSAENRRRSQFGEQLNSSGNGSSGKRSTPTSKRRQSA